MGSRAGKFWCKGGCGQLAIATSNSYTCVWICDDYLFVLNCLIAGSYYWLNDRLVLCARSPIGYFSVLTSVIGRSFLCADFFDWSLQSLLKQQGEEEHVTCMLDILSAMIDSEDIGAICQSRAALPSGLHDRLSESCLLPAIVSYLRNDSG